jgi:hypothetical protein
MLNINYENVKNYKTVCILPEGESNQVTGNLAPVTFALGFSMALNLGVQRVTEENLDDVWERVYAWDRIVGPLRTSATGEPIFFTYDEVKNHVGLHVNAVDLSLTKFWRKVRDTLSEQAASERAFATQSK